MAKRRNGLQELWYYLTEYTEKHPLNPPGAILAAWFVAVLVWGVQFFILGILVLVLQWLGLGHILPERTTVALAVLSLVVPVALVFAHGIQTGVENYKRNHLMMPLREAQALYEALSWEEQDEMSEQLRNAMHPTIHHWNGILRDRNRARLRP